MRHFVPPRQHVVAEVTVASYFGVQIQHKSARHIDPVPDLGCELLQAMRLLLAIMLLLLLPGGALTRKGALPCRQRRSVKRGKLAARSQNRARYSVKDDGRLDARFLGESREGLVQRVVSVVLPKMGHVFV
ncbi:hypothetical protein CTA1_11647 [Colletotrichum tanaceti]|uniref:Uncharacterized protein n=1 Tax=Colletotrichum tanaceti TaxID=1306861 RepID=A0A4U6XSY0_9PEZI|nr:hypothetical protein CTA1_11647 [Colletotrichum tanaceti]